MDMYNGLMDRWEILSPTSNCSLGILKSALNANDMTLVSFKSFSNSNNIIAKRNHEVREKEQKSTKCVVVYLKPKRMCTLIYSLPKDPTLPFSNRCGRPRNGGTMLNEPPSMPASGRVW